MASSSDVIQPRQMKRYAMPKYPVAQAYARPAPVAPRQASAANQNSNLIHLSGEAPGLDKMGKGDAFMHGDPVNVPVQYDQSWAQLHATIYRRFYPPHLG